MNISKISMNDNAQMVNFQARPRINTKAIKVAIPESLTANRSAKSVNDTFERNSADSIREEINEAINRYQYSSPAKKTRKSAYLNYGATNFIG